MKYSLPINKKGFTLIELLVVISIIAIISVVGIAVFQGQQKSARDAARRADIEAIAQALEAQKSAGSTTYPGLGTTFFASGTIPADPTNTNTGAAACPGVCKYCVKSGGAAACATTDSAVGSNSPASGATWTVCANLEAGGFVCRSNAQ